MHMYNYSDLKKIEHELAGNIIFGDTEYLNQCTWTSYEHGSQCLQNSC